MVSKQVQVLKSFTRNFGEYYVPKIHVHVHTGTCMYMYM